MLPPDKSMNENARAMTRLSMPFVSLAHGPFHNEDPLWGRLWRRLNNRKPLPPSGYVNFSWVHHRAW